MRWLRQVAAVVEEVEKKFAERDKRERDDQDDD